MIAVYLWEHVHGNPILLLGRVYFIFSNKKLLARQNQTTSIIILILLLFSKKFLTIAKISALLIMNPKFLCISLLVLFFLRALRFYFIFVSLL